MESPARCSSTRVGSDRDGLVVRHLDGDRVEAATLYEMTTLVLSEPVLACVVELFFAQLVGVDASRDAPAVVDRAAMQVGPWAEVDEGVVVPQPCAGV